MTVAHADIAFIQYMTHPIEKPIKTPLAYFYQWEQRTPNEIFLRQPIGKQWIEMSWLEVGTQARKLANFLIQQSLPPKSHIGIFSKNCYEWIITDLAIMMSGHISVPFYPNLTPDQLREIVELSDISMLFAGKLDNWDEHSRAMRASMPIVSFTQYSGNATISFPNYRWENIQTEYTPIIGKPMPEMEDIWTILFTSGTTGSPKGVIHTYETVSSLIENERQEDSLRIFGTEQNRFFSYLPLNHIAERVIVELAALFTGGSISFAESIQTFPENLREVQPTLFMAVPRIWEKTQQRVLDKFPNTLLQLLLLIPGLSSKVKEKIKYELGLSNTRVLLTGGAMISEKIISWFNGLDIDIQEVYGMTENCGACSLKRKGVINTNTVGQPLRQVEIKIAPGSGEILMRAPWVMKGYYNDPEKTAEVLRDGYLHTGDQGELTPDGSLRILGRVQDTFKSAKGKYIIPNLIENYYNKSDLIDQVCVVGLGIPQPLALVILSKKGNALSAEEVSKYFLKLRETTNIHLADYEAIKNIVIMKEPWTINNHILTPTLKVKRNHLHRKYRDYLLHWYDSNDGVVWE